MKIVIQTQHLENYAAHEEFTGAFHWKAKGGNTFILEGVNIDQAKDEQFWIWLLDQIRDQSVYFEENIVSSELVDDIEDNQQYCEDWETPIILRYAAPNMLLASQYLDAETCQSHGMKSDITGKKMEWDQIKGKQENYSMRYQVDHDKWFTYQEYCQRSIAS